MRQRLHAVVRRFQAAVEVAVSYIQQVLPDGPRLQAFIRSARDAIRPRTDLALENIALRQQLAILQKEKPRPQLRNFDRGFWILLRRCWSKWERVIAIVQPSTVVRWHRKGFRAFWRRKSKQKRRSGRPPIDPEIRSTILRIAEENPTWGAPRIHAELRKLGFDVAQRTVSRYLLKRPPNPEQMERWRAFLRNHRGSIAAMDFLTVPTLLFSVLHVFFVIHHERRKILHFNVTFSPSPNWIKQQLREAFPYDTTPKYLIFDRDSKFDASVIKTIKSMGMKPKQIAPRKPWQNGVAERWVGSCRRELLDHIIPLSEGHLSRVLRSYVEYYNEDRCHLTLAKDSPIPRSVTDRPSLDAEIIALPRVGGLHHRYEWRQAA